MNWKTICEIWNIRTSHEVLEMDRKLDIKCLKEILEK